MKRAISVFSIALATAILAGCSGMPVQTNTSTPAVPNAPTRDLSLTMPHYASASTVADRRKPWMLPEAKKASALIYVGDWATNDVDVLDYKNGKQVGTLTGLSEPYGMCVDGKGDIYVANFGAGNVVEYAHGGTKVVNTYNSGGEPQGCSVDAKGDVAVSSFSPGEAIVFGGGDPSKSTTYTSPCVYQWALGYDDKGNLIGVGEESTGTIAACTLLSGSKSMTTLSGCCVGPIKIDFPGGTMWDGQHIGLGDQEAGGTFLTGIWPSALSGTVLSPSHGEVRLESADCADDVNPFVLGKKNTPLNRRQAKLVVGSEQCSGGASVDIWHYPSGVVLKSFVLSPGTEPYGAAVSLAQ
jgi:hypothetical protein